MINHVFISLSTVQILILILNYSTCKLTTTSHLKGLRNSWNNGQLFISVAHCHHRANRSTRQSNLPQTYTKQVWMQSGLIVSVAGSGLSGIGSSPGRGHCVVFLGKTLYSQCLPPPRCMNSWVLGVTL